MKTLESFLVDCVTLAENSMFLGLDLVAINSAIPGVIKTYTDYSFKFQGVTLNRETTEVTVSVTDGDIILKKTIPSTGLSIPYELGRL